MMNAELVAGGEERIIIPTFYRANYLSALKALSQTNVPEPLIRTLGFAQRWTAAVVWVSWRPVTPSLIRWRRKTGGSDFECQRTTNCEDNFLSRLTDLIAQAKTKDPALGKELEREFQVLSSRRSFGLNFERHRPESVELPGQSVRKGDKVRVLPSRGSTVKGDQRLWKVLGFETAGGVRLTQVELLNAAEPEQQKVAVEDLVVVAEFRDYIYPGLVSTGRVERGGDKPFHTVINGENFHALEALTFTHRDKIDAIYIDPPYNTGARDWKYNNDYVGEEDLFGIPSG